MRRPRLLWQLTFASLALVVASLLTAGAIAGRFVAESRRSALHGELAAAARLAGSETAAARKSADRAALAAACERIAAALDVEIAVVLTDGDVACDTAEGAVDDPATTREVREALAGRDAESIRHRHELGQRVMYVAVPARDGERVAAAIRAARPMTGVDLGAFGVLRAIALAGLPLALAAVVAGWLIHRRIARPLAELKVMADRIAEGDFGGKLEIPSERELGEVAESLNDMNDRLQARIRTLIRQGHEQQAVLASMAEGVLAVDQAERVISLNQAAADLLGAVRHEAVGRTIPEVVRNSDLRKFVVAVLASGEPSVGDALIQVGADRVLQAHGTVLRDAADRTIGAVIVLNDVTRLRTLENLRRDFVANVSHELKTPITSIKGFVETLLDGALSDPENAERFLRIVSKQADRLNAIIEDLLSLSRLEQDQDVEIQREPAPLAAVLDAAAQNCQPQALKREIAVVIDCPADLTASINAPLLEQALSNLLDNAIKYSEPAGEVRLSAAIADRQLRISVRDRGAGIPPEHLARIFERFYRVDKARSRHAGGTGLGLAIVKHIVQAHGGKVTVESAPGEGSTFTICVPA